MAEQEQVAVVADNVQFGLVALNLVVLAQVGACGGFDAQCHNVVVGLRAGGAAVDGGFGADGCTADQCADAAAQTQAQEGRGQNGEGVAFDILHILFLGYGRLGVQTAFKGWAV
ncbi:hypothetical protein NEISUBOT_04668 [Neisseria subflava NJ9703]|uniref:Uncharacterized protein n=1 Tax=Neisseria subflava NJ9703 TaxID=546268 RepID=A0A9W5IQQ5_NEISU|nr:hypothetical protein NEISUBOT_04668 [Neisseria subflava NJ9703]